MFKEKYAYMYLCLARVYDRMRVCVRACAEGYGDGGAEQHQTMQTR